MGPHKFPIGLVGGCAKVVTCPFCGHRQRTRTENITLCCSQCQRKFTRPATVIEILGPITVAAPALCRQCGQLRSDLRACYIDDEAAIICRQCLEGLK